MKNNNIPEDPEPSKSSEIMDEQEGAVSNRILLKQTSPPQLQPGSLVMDFEGGGKDAGSNKENMMDLNTKDHGEVTGTTEDPSSEALAREEGKEESGLFKKAFKLLFNKEQREVEQAKPRKQTSPKRQRQRQDLLTIEDDTLNTSQAYAKTEVQEGSSFEPQYQGLEAQKATKLSKQLGDHQAAYSMSGSASMQNGPGTPFFQVMEWDDPVEERPVVFKIEKIENIEGTTFYTVEVHDHSFTGSLDNLWCFRKRYSEFRNLFIALKTLASTSQSMHYQGLRQMLSEGTQQAPTVASASSEFRSPANDSSFLSQSMLLGVDDSSTIMGGPSGENSGKGGQNLSSSFMASQSQMVITQAQSPPNGALSLKSGSNRMNLLTVKPLSVTAQGSYSGISFPGRKIFKMNQSVIRKRMAELAQFLNDLVDTRKCVYSDSASFNIFTSADFLKFIDNFCEHKQALDFAKEEQQKRIERIVKEARDLHDEKLVQKLTKATQNNLNLSMDSFQTSEKMFSHSVRRKQLKPSAFKNETTSVKKKFFSLGFNKKVEESQPKDRNSPRLSDQEQLVKVQNNSFDVDEFDKLNKSQMVEASPLPFRVGPNSEEVHNFYAGKEAPVIIDTLLKFLNDTLTFNKDEHLQQFFKLYQAQTFRLKTELRLKLFLGTHVKPIKRSQLFEEAVSEGGEVKVEEPKINGIVQLIGAFQKDLYGGGKLQADYALKFLADLLDYSKCPQADSFNILFNNLDIFWVFKMSLPQFIKNMSPYRMQAQKLLHQFIVQKPVVSEEEIKIFFSEDAVKQVSPDLISEYGQFMRFHKRQLNSVEFGIGTNASTYKIEKEKKKTTQSVSKSFIRPRVVHRESDDLLVKQTLKEHANNHNWGDNRSHRSKSTRPRLARPKRIPVASSASLDNSSVASNSPVLSPSEMSAIRDSFMVNFRKVQKEWIEDLKSTNPQCVASRKELLQLDRFRLKALRGKKVNYEIHLPLISQKIPIYKSDFSSSMKTERESVKNDMSAVALFTAKTSIPIGAFQAKDVLQLLFSDVSKGDMPFPEKQKLVHQFEGVSKSEQCIYATMGGIDFIYQVKNFETDTDGFFSVVTLAEVDVKVCKLTGRYVLFKLKEVTKKVSSSKHIGLRAGSKSPIIEKSPTIDDKIEQNLAIANALAPTITKKELEVIQESVNEHSLTTMSQFNSAVRTTEQLIPDNLGESQVLVQSQLIERKPRKTSFAIDDIEIEEEEKLTKLSAIVDWVSADEKRLANEVIEKQGKKQKDIVELLCQSISRLSKNK